jgi:hypothetical protein
MSAPAGGANGSGAGSGRALGTFASAFTTGGLTKTSLDAALPVFSEVVSDF